MAHGSNLCAQHVAGASWYGNGLDAGSYLAAVRAETDALPRSCSQDDHIVRHGYGVGFGQWFFFYDLAPALAFSRSARMSLDCRGIGVYQAVHELRFCHRHNTDERVLHLAGPSITTTDEDQVAHLKRFVQGVKERPWSAAWHSPTGYITDYNNGRPVQTKRRSLPL
ncbi:hypothetical protein MXD61_17505 [Frankia sp. AgPm24]|uniref:hypothetical protein n=1 Tax=Frankia sp. AgPm24 TaxID=631128 RepID=UPI00200D4A50|nr:hypothetical protein [Frankia sp. AgPm24]MCK9923643.1 hypothetical protein [Frankia sp. AgPm24]